MAPTTARWIASALMLSRLCTENTAVPLISRRGACAPCPRAPAAASPKARCTAAMASACASRSLPAAWVLASMTARGASRAAHTPSSLFGAVAGISASAMRADSPVGSRSSSGLKALPAGVPSSDSVSSTASRKPAAVK